MKPIRSFSRNQNSDIIIKKADIIIVVFLIFFIGIVEHSFSAVDTLVAKSEITNVTVFFNGAQITRSTKLKAIKGKQLIKIEQLPKEINSQSIQVEKINGAKILSVKHELNYKDEGKKSLDQKEVEIKIEDLETKLREINNRINVFNTEEKILIDNSHLSKSGEGSKIKDIKEAADFYRQRLNEIQQEKLKLNSELKKVKENIQKTYTELNEITSQKRKTYSQILILLELEKETATNLNLSYYIESAGWEPLYDFRVDDIMKPLVIGYNANVYQSSGEEWKNVKIKLSNNNPTLKGSKPELPVWYLGRTVPGNFIKPLLGSSALKGRVIDSKTNESIPFANVVLLRGTNIIASSTTDFDGHYAIKPIPAGTYNAQISYLGYNDAFVRSIVVEGEKSTLLDFKLNQQSISLQSIEYSRPFMDAEAKSGGTVTREEYRSMATKNISSVAATSRGVYQRDDGTSLNVRGSRGSGDTYIDGVRIQQPIINNNIANSLKTTVANLEYEIEIPYTIPSDGEDYSIKIKDVTLQVEYVYYAVPKLETEAFLTAEIHDWSQLNLLSGKSSIYYQGTFTGESYIDVNKASDTLSISLGRDKSIIIKREANKQFSDKRIFTNNIKQTIASDITIKNTRNSRIKIFIEDQYPVSERKSVEIELEELSLAKAEPKTGKLKWELILEPNEKKVLTSKYSVKYPRNTYLAFE